ncbi:MAG: hypothetical protein AMJ91_07680 [candidate division Zixibacteria bacterium SM23_73_3]|nr:MAG: hypothetical protein AMJ91_07680 [candidate division Zixibacteria bacterium SM23_73_3]
MRSRYLCLLLGLVVMTIVSITTVAYDRTETFRFENIHSINIETISGNIKICPGDESKLIVELINNLDEPELLDPELEADDGELFIEEDFIGRNVRGETHWKIYLPKSASLRSIKCNSASGDMIFEEFKADYITTESASGKMSVNSVGAKELELSSASGAIVLEDCRADFIEAESASGKISVNSLSTKELNLSTASGKIAAEDCEADFIKASSASGRISVSSLRATELKLSNASGRIVVEDGEIDEMGKASSASGDVELFLPQLPTRLEASSASGDVDLKVVEFGENFTMTLMKRADKGRIKCPFEYTEKETIRLHKNDRYLTDRYLVERGKGGPDIKLSTASGTIKIETDTKGK